MFSLILVAISSPQLFIKPDIFKIITLLTNFKKIDYVKFKKKKMVNKYFLIKNNALRN